MNNLFANNTKQELFFGLLLASVFAPSLMLFANAIALRLPIICSFGESMNSIIAFISMALSLPYICKRLRVYDYVFYLILLLVYGFQYIYYPSNERFLNEYFIQSMLTTVPLYFIGRIWNVERFDDLFSYIAILGIFAIFFYKILLTSTVTDAAENNEHLMSVSYETEFLCGYVTISYQRKKSLIYLLAVFIGIFSMMTMGTRGPVFCYFLFVITLFFLFGASHKKKILIPILFLIACIIYSYLTEIALIINFYLDSLGFSTRILDQLLYSDFQDASMDERDYIIEVIRYVLNNSTETSYGLFGTWNYVKNYSHRIYWDFWFNFGYIIGSILLLLYLYVVAKAVRMSNHRDESIFLIMLVCLGFVSLFFSNYFMLKKEFWLLLGFAVQIIRRNGSLHNANSIMDVFNRIMPHTL